MGYIYPKQLTVGFDAAATNRTKGSIMSIEQFIDNEVKGNDVVLFMKGTPQFPMCGFSGQVVQILDYLGVPYKGLNVLEPTTCATASRPTRTGRPFRSSTSRASSSAAATSSARCSRPANCSGLLKDKGVPVKESASA